jgi:hypothetical protein
MLTLTRMFRLFLCITYIALTTKAPLCSTIAEHTVVVMYSTDSFIYSIVPHTSNTDYCLALHRCFIMQQIFALFDRLLVLAQGRTVYFGPASLAYDHFSNLQQQISSNSQFTVAPASNNNNTKHSSTATATAVVVNKGNPADYVMSVVAGAQHNTATATQPCLTVDMLAQACVDTVHWSELQRKCDNVSATVHYSVRTKQRKYARTLYAQSYILTQRHLLKVFKNKRFVGTCKYYWMQHVVTLSACEAIICNEKQLRACVQTCCCCLSVVLVYYKTDRLARAFVLSMHRVHHAIY